MSNASAPVDGNLMIIVWMDYDSKTHLVGDTNSPCFELWDVSIDGGVTEGIIQQIHVAAYPGILNKRRNVRNLVVR